VRDLKIDPVHRKIPVEREPPQEPDLFAREEALSPFPRDVGDLPELFRTVAACPESQGVAMVSPDPQKRAFEDFMRKLTQFFGSGPKSTTSPRNISAS
jgi:hypothetical protein